MAEPVPWTPARIEGAALVTGRGQFLDDLDPLPGTLVAAVVRSTQPHAWLHGVDLSRARAHPGVAAVIGPEEVRAALRPFPLSTPTPMPYYPADGTLRIGAAVRQRTVERSPLTQAVPLIGLAMPFVGHRELRSRGTVCGSLAHADPAAELPAVACCLGATVHLARPSGPASVRAGEFFAGAMTTTAGPEDVVSAVEFPAAGPGEGFGFAEIARRHGDFARAGVAVRVRVNDDGGVAQARLAAAPAVRGAGRPGAGAGAEPGTGCGGQGAAVTTMGRPPPRARVAAGEPVAVTMTVNGAQVTVSVPARMHLADALRERLGLTGTHLGCEHGVCGMCTVLVDGAAARACLLFAVQCEGAEIVTVEGLGSPDEQHPLQRALSAHHGLQCGFCTSGMLISTVALLREHPSPSDDEIRAALSGNLCRCTGYQNIVNAVRLASRYVGNAI